MQTRIITKSDYNNALEKSKTDKEVVSSKICLSPGPVPIGYKNISEFGKTLIVPDEEKAPLIREAFDLASHKNVSLRKIQKFLSQRGLVSKHGKPLGIGSLHYLISNPFYAGLTHHNGQLVKGKHEPLIKKELFEKVQERLETRRHNRHEF